MIHHTEKLSNRKKIKRVTYVRARARARAYLTCFFPKWPPKKSKKSKKIFFFLFDPKYIYIPKMKFLGIKLRKKPFETVPSP